MRPNLQQIERDTYSESISGRNVHDHLKEKTVEELIAINESDRFPFHVMALSLTGDLNIGTIIRSSILHGAEKVLIYGRRKYDSRGSVGSHNYIEVERIDGFKKFTIDFDEDKFWDLIKERNYHPTFIEQGGVPLNEYEWEYPTGTTPLIIVGNETNGIPENILRRNHFPVVSIPQRGVIRSFNVSSAFNIATWDMRMKVWDMRMKKGLI